MIINLKEKYIEACSNSENLIGVSTTTLLYKTSWVRILLEQHIEGNDTNGLEVEVSFPEDDDSSKNDSSLLFDQFTEFIKYLQNLRDHGFNLCVIGAGCILTASKTLRQTPEDKLFRALLPPNVPP
ncbi:MAG: hypothetical protein E4H14_11565 [Candidatus Thorarchaeota archaeon]|nr:MAG: hypothetical protein E4H14_11565 [Candidatus Thorarchaeota archaeon]